MVVINAAKETHKLPLSMRAAKRNTQTSTLNARCETLNLLTGQLYSITVCPQHRRPQHHDDGCDSADGEGAYASKHGDDA